MSFQDQKAVPWHPPKMTKKFLIFETTTKLTTFNTVEVLDSTAVFNLY